MTPADDPQPPGECMACHGSGHLISGLGGTPHEVRCPWCEGTGTRIPGIDAQQHPAETPSRPPEPAATPASDGDAA